MDVPGVLLPTVKKAARTPLCCTKGEASRCAEENDKNIAQRIACVDCRNRSGYRSTSSDMNPLSSISKHASTAELNVPNRIQHIRIGFAAKM